MMPADILGSTEVYTVDGHDYLGRIFEWYDDFLESCPALRDTKEAIYTESSTRIRIVAKGISLDLWLLLGS